MSGQKIFGSKPAIVLSVITAIITLCLTCVKLSDAFDFFVERSRPLQDQRVINTKQESANQQILTALGEEKRNMEDTQKDIKIILRELRRR